MTKNQMLCRSAIFAALYVVLTAINPIGWGIVQIRPSVILSVIPFYKREYKPALIIGVIIANAFSPFGIVDVVTGASIWLLSYYLVDIMPFSMTAKIVCSAILGAALVATELVIITGTPLGVVFPALLISQTVTMLTGKWICKVILGRVVK